MSQAPKPAISGRQFLDRIVDAVQGRIARLRSQSSFASLANEASQHPRRSFSAALTAHPPSIIAEIKKASPSKGVFRSEFDPLALAIAYEKGGAAAFSVVTEPRFFLGDDRWVAQIRNATTAPILRKDFILDPLQVAESAALGADAILLIARLLSAEQMRELADAASRCGLDVLFEAHDEEDLEKIAGCAPRIVGINARDLDSFAVDTTQFATLGGLIPTSAIRVAESGLDSAAAIQSVGRLGYSAFLIGEALVRAADPAAAVESLRVG
jgi:indole-3-glycerol phosphate synthase